MLDSKELKSRLNYDPETGVFTWLSVAPYGKYKVGDIAGHCQSDKYVRITIDGTLHSAHRLAILYCTGKWPNVVDHIDGDPSNNKIINLRDSTMLDNSKNQKKNKNNRSGLSGVHWNNNRSKWYVTVSALGSRKFLGSFVDVGDAIKARKKYNSKNGFSYNHGEREV